MTKMTMQKIDENELTHSKKKLDFDFLEAGFGCLSLGFLFLKFISMFS